MLDCTKIREAVSDADDIELGRRTRAFLQRIRGLSGRTEGHSRRVLAEVSRFFFDEGEMTAGELVDPSEVLEEFKVKYGLYTQDEVDAAVAEVSGEGNVPDGREPEVAATEDSIRTDRERMQKRDAAVRKAQDDFLATKKMTREQLKGLSQQDRNKLNKEWGAFWERHPENQG